MHRTACKQASERRRARLWSVLMAACREPQFAEGPPAAEGTSESGLCLRRRFVRLTLSLSHHCATFTSAIIITTTAPLSDHAHHRDTRLPLAQGAYAEREARQSSKWATQWWASSEWVTWGRCTPAGSPTQDGGRCKVSRSSLLAPSRYNYGTFYSLL